MHESISINRQRLESTLNELRSDGQCDVYTTEIIDAYMGGFHSNLGVPATVSWNAQFGKHLSAHADELRIRLVSSENSIEVNGHPTTSAIWALLP